MSASAAARTRRSMTSHGVCRSDRLIDTWSWPSGAPRIAPAASAAVTPGTPTTSMSSLASASAGEAMAYTPASPLPISATA